MILFIKKPNWPVDMEHISATYQPIYCFQLVPRISSKERENMVIASVGYKMKTNLSQAGNPPEIQ